MPITPKDAKKNFFNFNPGQVQFLNRKFCRLNLFFIRFSVGTLTVRNKIRIVPEHSYHFEFNGDR